MTRDEAVAVFDRRRRAWLDEDLDGYLALFADDLVLETPMGAPVHGKAEYAKLVARSLKALQPVAFDFHAIAVHDTRVLAEWTITLRLRSGDGEISYRGMSVCELEGGEIKTWREYYDPAHLRPTPPAPTSSSAT